MAHREYGAGQPRMNANGFDEGILNKCLSNSGIKILMGKEKKNKTFDRLVESIQKVNEELAVKTAKSINISLTMRNWLFGYYIQEYEQHGEERADYGQHLIKNLSIELHSEFGKGFSVANLWNFRQFYITFPESEILYTLCRELSWSHIRLIMRLDSVKAREYYLSV